MAASTGPTSPRNVQGVGKAPWVSWVEASRFAEGTAYATFDRHMYGDMKPYLYKTTDYGQSWTPLPVQESGIRGYAHVIKEDNVNPNLLFLGTEFGLWVSVDGGQRWAQYKGIELSGGGGARHLDSSAHVGPDSGHARPRHLDHRRHLPAARAHART